MKDRWLLLLVLLLLRVADPWPARAEQPTAAPGAEQAPPMDLLVFLGEWETANGDWIDPTLLDKVELSEVTGLDQPDPEKSEAAKEEQHDDNTQSH